MFEVAWLQSTLDVAAELDPEVLGFHGANHNSFVEDFKQLDNERIEISSGRVRRANAERAVAVMNEHPRVHYFCEQQEFVKRDLLVLESVARGHSSAQFGLGYRLFKCCNSSLDFFLFAHQSKIGVASANVRDEVLNLPKL